MERLAGVEEAVERVTMEVWWKGPKAVLSLLYMVDSEGELYEGGGGA